MGITIDFSNTGDFEALANGVYEGRIASVEHKQASTGNWMISAVVKLADDPARKCINRQVYNNFVLTEKALWRTKQFLKESGWPDEQLEGTLDLDINELVGLEVYAVLGPPDAGYNYNKVDLHGKNWDPSKAKVPAGSGKASAGSSSGGGSW